MGIFEIIGGVALVLLAIVVIIVVCMQEGKGGMGVLDGSGGETNDRYSGNRARTTTEMLVRATKGAGTAMILLTLLLAVVGARM